MTTALRGAPYEVQPDEVQWCHSQVEGGAQRRLPVALSRPVATVVGTSAALVALPGQIIDFVTVAAQTLATLRAVVLRTNALLQGAEDITASAEGIIRDADRAATGAAGAIAGAHTLTASAVALLGAYSDALNRLAPTMRRLADTTQTRDVDAPAHLLGRLSRLADAMDHEVMPLLGHLEEVVPKVNQLLDRAARLSHMASRLPKVFRRPNHQPSRLNPTRNPTSRRTPMTIFEPTASAPLPEPSAPVRHPSLRVVPSRHGVDLAAAERAVADLLVALGKDPTSEHLADTPRRVAHSFAELLTPRVFDLTTFPNDEGYDELVLAKAIPVQSLCEHHLLPFHGIAHIGYLPGERILGLSKLARVIELFSRDLQVQERLTQQVADGLQEHLAPKGVGVVIEAEHLCMSLRGVRATGSRTVTSALHGLLREDARSRQEFFSLAGVAR